jgi:hypothetical protein
MHAPISELYFWRMVSLLFCSSMWSRLGLLASIVASTQPVLPPTQAQVAQRFLGEILRADYPAAYHRLAPEVRAKLRPVAFAAAAQPLQQLGQQRGAAVRLYKLGTRLSGRGGPGRWFYSFSFASDSARRPPPVLLEVTFRDTTSRQVLGFGLRRR